MKSEMRVVRVGGKIENWGIKSILNMGLSSRGIGNGQKIILR